jgi:hypothetical protein
MIQIDDDGLSLPRAWQSATAEATAETVAPAAIAGTPGAAKTAGARVPDSIDGRAYPVRRVFEDDHTRRRARLQIVRRNEIETISERNQSFPDFVQ